MSNNGLKGKNIVITRAKNQASKFAALLESYGANVLLCPTIEIVPPKDFSDLDQAIRNIHSYQWLLFTSVNGVEKFCERFPKGEIGELSCLKTAAIGPLTAARMKSFGIPVHFVSKEYVAESLLEEITVEIGDRVLIPRAQEAREILPDTLRARGAIVDVVWAYRTITDESKTNKLKEWLGQNKVDCITFTSSSTVHNFFSFFTLEEKEHLIHNSKILAASIGPITTQTLNDFGWRPAIVAVHPTTQDLAEAIGDYYD